MNPRLLHRAVARLQSAPSGDQLLNDDIWRLSNAYYGAISWPITGQRDPVVILMGARSGLEVAAALLRSAKAVVLVVEPCAERRCMIETLISASPLSAVVGNVGEALSWLAGRSIAYLRYDGLQFCAADLIQLLGPQRCGHLCGTYDASAVDPLKLYRESRDRLATTFFWRDAHSGLCFGSDRGAVEIEVSVIVPAYKVSAEIDQCLGTLATQTLGRIEILVINDGSPDDTGLKANVWEAKFPGRVRVIHQKNSGCASARMAGIREARGEFIGFVDGDDWVHPAMFEELYRAAILRGAEIAQCGYVEAFSDISSRRDLSAHQTGGAAFPQLLNKLHDYLTLKPTIWRRIYRREFLVQHGIEFPRDIRRFDDLPFQFEALALARRMAVIPDAYYFYRQGRPEQDVAVRDERLFVHFQIFDWLHKRVMSWGDARIEAQLVLVELNTHLWALSRIEDSLRSRYTDQAQQQFLRNRIHLTPISLLRIAAGKGGDAFRFALGALFRHRSKWKTATTLASPPVAPVLAAAEGE